MCVLVLGMNVYMGRMGFMAIITVMVFCARSQDSLSSVSGRRVRVVISTAGFTGGRKPCPKTRVFFFGNHKTLPTPDKILFVYIPELYRFGLN